MKRPARFWPVLTLFDWNFSSCQDRHLDYCLAWELHRELIARKIKERYEGEQMCAFLGKPLPLINSARTWELWTFDPGIHGPCTQNEAHLSLKIDWRLGKKFWMSVFEDWWVSNEPSSTIESIRFKKVGAGSAIRQSKYKLRMLGAVRVLDHCRGNSAEAWGYPGAGSLFGKNTQNLSFWSDAKREVSKLLNFAST